MSNFDGEVTVRAEAGQVLLQENEGTIVIRGREPSDPIRLAHRGAPPPAATRGGGGGGGGGWSSSGLGYI